MLSSLLWCLIVILLVLTTSAGKSRGHNWRDDPDFGSLEVKRYVSGSDEGRYRSRDNEEREDYHRGNREDYPEHRVDESFYDSEYSFNRGHRNEDEEYSRDSDGYHEEHYPSDEYRYESDRRDDYEERYPADYEERYPGDYDERYHDDYEERYHDDRRSDGKRKEFEAQEDRYVRYPSRHSDVDPNGDVNNYKVRQNDESYPNTNNGDGTNTNNEFITIQNDNGNDNATTNTNNGLIGIQNINGDGSNTNNGFNTIQNDNDNDNATTNTNNGLIGIQNIDGDGYNTNNGLITNPNPTQGSILLPNQNSTDASDPSTQNYTSSQSDANNSISDTNPQDNDDNIQQTTDDDDTGVLHVIHLVHQSRYHPPEGYIDADNTHHYFISLPPFAENDKTYIDHINAYNYNPTPYEIPE